VTDHGHAVESGEKKRRLPVLSSGPSEETAEPRPGWQWIGFGAVLVFAAWLPLAALLQKLSPIWLSSLVSGAKDEAEVLARVRELRGSALAWYYVLTVGPQVLALAIAAGFGGFVVGRFGKPEAGVREAALAGAVTGLVACALACTSSGVSWTLLVVVAIAAAFSGIGGKIGLRR
jgi:hypothetical protein